MKALGIAAAATIALAPFSVLATIPVVAQAASGGAADEEPPWWHSALHYGVFMTIVGLAAWTIGLSVRHAGGTPPVPPRPGPRRGVRGALAVKPAPASPTIDPAGSEVKRRVLAEAAHRCAIPTCRKPTCEIAHIVSETDDSFENLIALCANCQEKGIDLPSIRRHKRNLGILNSRYCDFERRLFDQIAETGRRSFVVGAGFEVPLLRAVDDGLLKRVEPTQHGGEPTHYKYEVADAGLDFVSRYVRGEDIS